MSETTTERERWEVLELRSAAELDYLARVAGDAAQTMNGWTLQSTYLGRTVDLPHKGPIVVALEPGDATVYHLLIVPTSAHVGAHNYYLRGGQWIVSLLNLGRSMPWRTTLPPHWSDLVGRVTDTQRTAHVVAAFLTLLAEAVTS